ncbi:DUF3379 family protein [Colwelliaceae bacterium 6471]
MDDLQFRRSIYADPNSTDKDVRTAQREDPSKDNFAKEIQKLDKKISAALDVPVPEDLYNNLILRQTLSSHQQQKRKTRVQLALAASVAFAIGLTMNSMLFSSAYSNLGDYALAHVYHEADYFSNNDEAKVSLASLNEKMASFDGSFTSSIGKLLSADYCHFDGRKSLHLVFQGETDVVAVFVVPQSKDLIFESEFSDNKLNGASTKFARANVIVVGGKDEPLDQWQQNINDNVKWSI